MNAHALCKWIRGGGFLNVAVITEQAPGYGDATDLAADDLTMWLRPLAVRRPQPNEFNDLVLVLCERMPGGCEEWKLGKSAVVLLVNLVGDTQVWGST